MSPLSSLQTQLSNYNLGCAPAADLKAAPAKYIHADSQIFDKECISEFQLDLPVEMLFQKISCKDPALSFALDVTI